MSYYIGDNFSLDELSNQELKDYFYKGFISLGYSESESLELANLIFKPVTIDINVNEKSMQSLLDCFAKSTNHFIID